MLNAILNGCSFGTVSGPLVVTWYRRSARRDLDPLTMFHTLFALTGCMFLTLSPASLLAQALPFVHHTTRSQYLFPEEAEPGFLLSDGAPLRQAPSMDSAVVAKASAGGRVHVLEATEDSLALNGVQSHWYRIDHNGRVGWTWGGNLAQCAFGSHADAGVKFFGGIDHVTASDTGSIDFSYRLVAVKNGLELDRIIVRSFATGFEEIRNNGSLGLNDVDDVITLNVPCEEGCGCTTGQVVVFWSGGRFHHVADLMGTPDGEYSENVMFIYPSDMEGEANTIVRLTSTYEETAEEGAGEDEEQEQRLTRILRKEYLRWDGKALVPSGRAMEERRYEMALDDL